jgi:hypothetical protein
VALSVLTGCSAGSGDSIGAAPTSAGASPTGAAGSSASATSGAASPTAAASPTGSYQQQVLDQGRRLAQCARQHGLPNFPDPTGVDISREGLGFPRYPGVDKRDIVTAEERCPEIARQAPQPPPPGPPSATTLQRMRQYAQCMRQRGLSDFPDPRTDGTFPIRGTRYAGLAAFAGTNLTNELINADNVCRRYQINWYVRAS